MTGESRAQSAEDAEALKAQIQALQHEVANLQTALERRTVTAQATGILMQRHKITADEAFRLLVNVSQHTHIKLHDLALDLVETGVWPPPAMDAVLAARTRNQP